MLLILEFRTPPGSGVSTACFSAGSKVSGFDSFFYGRAQAAHNEIEKFCLAALDLVCLGPAREIHSANRPPA